MKTSHPPGLCIFRHAPGVLRGMIPLLFLALAIPALAGGSWQEEFAKMPLPSGVSELNETNCVKILLPAFHRNNAVKGLIFMPGATDEFYFFHRARARLTNGAPTLLDAVCALTNQTRIRVTCRAPFLVLHTVEDPLEPISVIEDAPTAERIKKKKFARYGLYDDRDWDFLHPLLSFHLDTRMLPGLHTRDSYHFFRHSFAAYDLTGWEILEAVAMAGKTQFKIQKRKVVFEGDRRFQGQPPVPVDLLIPASVH